MLLFYCTVSHSSSADLVILGLYIKIIYLKGYEIEEKTNSQGVKETFKTFKFTFRTFS